MGQYVLGIDLGGTKVEACLMDEQRQVLNRQRRFSEASLGFGRVVKNIREVVKKTAAGRSLAAIGIGTPGTYITKSDRLYGSPHTPLYETAGFIHRLEEELKIPLLVENDANCLALAEYFSSCQGKYSHVMAVIIGTGMGFGLILNNKLYRGAMGGAGEIGHTTINFNGRKCQCGRKGCAEAYLSGPSISRRYFERSKSKLAVPEIWSLYLQGDRIAREIFQESVELMSEILANMINTLDLEAIILGGGVSNLPIWYEELPKTIKIRLFGPPRPDIPIVPAKLGDSAGVVGAAYLALRSLNLMEF